LIVVIFILLEERHLPKISRRPCDLSILQDTLMDGSQSGQLPPASTYPASISLTIFVDWADIAKRDIKTGDGPAYRQ
jgi:hypothetical protein